LRKLFLFLFVVTLNHSAFTCGMDYDPAANYYNFFHQEAISDSTLHPFIFHWAGGYSPCNSCNNLPDLNIQAWFQYYGGAVNNNDLSHIVYKLPLEDLKQIRRKAQTGDFSFKVDSVLYHNKLVSMWMEDTILHPSLEYLIYAKECEYHAVLTRFSWNDEKKDYREAGQLNSLIERGIKLYHNTFDNRLKQRYGYQIVRMAHYARDYPRAIELCEELVEPLPLRNYLFFRTMEQKAGALNGMGDAEAAYWFAQVFDNCPDRRIVCLTSFKFTNERKWRAGVEACRINKQRAVFYAMRGLKKYANTVEEMENIYKIYPESKYLTLLLVRQINQFERRYFPSFGMQESYSFNYIEVANMNRLTKLCDKAIKSDRISDEELWKLAKAYIMLMSKDYLGCRELLATYDEKSRHYAQAQVLDFVAELSTLRIVDEQAETAFANRYIEISKLQKCNDLKDYMMDVFSKLYRKQHSCRIIFLLLLITIFF